MNKTNLGVDYRANKIAWIYEKFREWLYKFDAQMKAENRKMSWSSLNNFTNQVLTINAVR
jgi:hypothetical protein